MLITNHSRVDSHAISHVTSSSSERSEFLARVVTPWLGLSRRRKKGAGQAYKNRILRLDVGLILGNNKKNIL